jgi:hypothetical protein
MDSSSFAACIWIANPLDNAKLTGCRTVEADARAGVRANWFQPCGLQFTRQIAGGHAEAQPLDRVWIVGTAMALATAIAAIVRRTSTRENRHALVHCGSLHWI